MEELPSRRWYFFNCKSFLCKSLVVPGDSLLWSSDWCTAAFQLFLLLLLSCLWNLFFRVKKTSRELCRGPRDGWFFRDWRSTLESLLLRVDKAKDRVKLPASVERECLSRHSFRKISADAFQVGRKADTLALLALRTESLKWWGLLKTGEWLLELNKGGSGCARFMKSTDKRSGLF